MNKGAESDVPTADVRRELRILAQELQIGGIRYSKPNRLAFSIQNEEHRAAGAFDFRKNTAHYFCPFELNRWAVTRGRMSA